MRILPVAMLALIGACAPLPERLTPVEAERAWETHQRQAQELQSWFLRGRLAIRDEREGWSANLHWRQQPDEYVMRLLAPLGQGTAELHGSDGHVSLITADNQLLTAPDAETLMLNNLGWTVPVEGLMYWVRGLPLPGVHADELDLDEAGRLAVLQQAGWDIVIDEYMQADGRTLPRRLEMSNEHFRLRLVVQSWESLNE